MNLSLSPVTRSPVAIVRGAHIGNVSRGGRRSYAPIRGLLKYISYGHYADQPTFALERPTELLQGVVFGQEPQERGVWLDQNGRSHAQPLVQQWAKDKVHRFSYDHTYQLLLSIRDGRLEPEAYNQTLQAGSEISGVQEWRYMVHDDTAHQHAHVFLFRHEKLTGKDYRSWQQTMLQELSQLQTERQAALAQQQTQSEVAQMASGQHKVIGQGMELADG